MPKQEESEDIRQLQLLEALEEEPDVRQADLAARLGIAVGTVNWLLKRLANRGFVKVQRIGQWNWRYILTPRGFTEKARLTQGYIQDSMQLYRETRETARKILSDLRERGHGRMRLAGDPDNDLLDVCRLTCLEQGFEVADSGVEDVPVLRVEGREVELEEPEGSAMGSDSGDTQDGKLREVIRRIVEVADPEKIILFGSAARGETGANSDLDLLVIKSGTFRKGRLIGEIYRHMIGVGQAVDIIVATPEDIERYGNVHALVYKPALRGGKVVYERNSEARASG